MNVALDQIVAPLDPKVGDPRAQSAPPERPRSSPKRIR
jgi:hypothetical protein